MYSEMHMYVYNTSIMMNAFSHNKPLLGCAGRLFGHSYVLYSDLTLTASCDCTFTTTLQFTMSTAIVQLDYELHTHYVAALLICDLSSRFKS